MANNFNLIRLLAAWLVLFSHSFALTGSTEPFGHFSGYFTGGSLAVDIFFLISGFLITKSAAKRGLLDFTIARVLRIFPALVFAVIFTICIGALFTSLPQGIYWTHPATWGYLRNIYLFPIHFRLPGVFEDNPNISANGSLWTLPIEVTMYVVSAIFLVLRVRLRSFFLIFAMALGVAYFIGRHKFGMSWEDRGWAILPGVWLYNFLGLGYFFFVGAALSKMSFAPNRSAALFALIAFVASAWVPSGELIYCITLPYLVYYAAFEALPAWTKPTADFSYGIYVYAFPVQQSIVHLFGASIGALWLAALATPFTILLGALSWYLIEDPFLRLKDWRKRLAIPMAAPSTDRQSDAPCPQPAGVAPHSRI